MSLYVICLFSTNSKPVPRKCCYKDIGMPKHKNQTSLKKGLAKISAEKYSFFTIMLVMVVLHITNSGFSTRKL